MSRRLLAHTADLRAELAAPDEAALYDEAVALVRELLFGESPVEGREIRHVEPSGADDAERFFRFVRELLYLADAESFLPAAVRVGRSTTVLGEPFDGARHRSEHQLKAVTRHAFRFERTADGVVAELLFDL